MNWYFQISTVLRCSFAFKSEPTKDRKLQSWKSNKFSSREEAMAEIFNHFDWTGLWWYTIDDGREMMPDWIVKCGLMQRPWWKVRGNLQMKGGWEMHIILEYGIRGQLLLLRAKYREERKYRNSTTWRNKARRSEISGEIHFGHWGIYDDAEIQLPAYKGSFLDFTSNQLAIIIFTSQNLTKRKWSFVNNLDIKMHVC